MSMSASGLLAGTVSPFEELLGYEYLYSKKGSSLKTISEATFQRSVLPSEAAREEQGLLHEDDEVYSKVKEFITNVVLEDSQFSVLVNGTYQFPSSIGEAESPVPILYCQGDVTLFNAPSVSIVGARTASLQGMQRASKLAKDLAKGGVAIVSGLAKGIDTAALQSAIQNAGHVIGVIGTPINEAYPKENTELQKLIAKEHLLVSQVPFYRYEHEPFNNRRWYFPQRNVTMAAISKATVIVEASDRSGTLTQANACIKQGRKLFIMRSCFDNQRITWPEKMLEKGAEILDDSQQVLDFLHSKESLSPKSPDVK